MRIAAVLLALALGTARGQDARPFAKYDARYGRPELPRSGTIGELPPAPLVIHAAADGTLRLADDGPAEEVTPAELRRVLQRRLDRLGLAKTLDTEVLLRADARLPAIVGVWLMEVCERASLYGMFWSVRPPSGDGEGAFAVFHYPLVMPRRKRELMIGVGSEVAADLPGLYAALREGKIEDVSAVLVPGPNVPLQSLLSACDVVHRAGVEDPRFVGMIGVDKLEKLKYLVGALAPRPKGREGIFLGLERVAGAAGPLPAVERVRDGYAGWSEVTWAIGVGGPTQRPTPTQAVDHGLAWLAAHQMPAGRWDADGFMLRDPKDDRADGPGRPSYDVAVTGLALLAFLGAGYVDRGPKKDNPYAKNVDAGLRYLLSVQDKEGCLGLRTDERYLYGHAIGASALCEGYWMTRRVRYREPAQKALDFLAAMRRPDLAWGHAASGSDTSLTCWCLVALKGGRFAGLRVDDAVLAGGRGWLERHTDAATGRTAYDDACRLWRPAELADRFPASKSEAMTAAGIWCRILLGEDPRTSDAIRKGVGLCAALPPAWNEKDGSIDMNYWYWGTCALFQVGGDSWKRWNTAMLAALLDHQHPDGAGAKAGSWDPVGVWGRDGGRVYATALMTLCLEVYYRYERAFGGKDEDEK